VRGGCNCVSPQVASATIVPLGSSLCMVCVGLCLHGDVSNSKCGRGV
jgi:hypothetical protein